ASLLRDSSAPPGHSVRIFQVKNVDELDPELLNIPGSPPVSKLVLLVLPEIRDAVLERLGEPAERFHVMDFDPGREKLSAAIREAVAKSEIPTASQVRIALI